MKRVLQISLDIIVDAEVDGIELAGVLTHELTNKGLTVAGADFTEDMTEHYDEEFINTWC